MAERINNEIVFASHYIDRIGIVQMTKLAKSDEELGKFIREYVSQCEEWASKDEPFPSTSNMVGYKPSTFFDKYKESCTTTKEIKIKKPTEEQINDFLNFEMPDFAAEELKLIEKSKNKDYENDNNKN